MDQPISTPSAPRPPFPWRHVVVSVIATGIIVGVGTVLSGLYIFRAYSSWSLIEENSNLRAEQSALRGKIQALESMEPTTSAEQAKGIVERFLNFTLPPGPINYTSAAMLLAEPLASELRADISAMPRWYGIQDGPDHTRVLGVQADKNTAVVTVGAYYGDIADRTYNADRIWEFRLQYSDTTGWLITLIFLPDYPANAQR